MAKFTAAPGLDERVALMAAPKVRQIANSVRDTAKKTAPEAKTWVHRNDNDVRDSHLATPEDPFNFNVPDNLRFKVPSMDWDMNDPESNRLKEWTWMLAPEDWTSGAVVNILQCRCEATHDKHVIRDGIRTEGTQVTGTKVRVVVSCTGNRVVPAEFGESYDHFAPKAVGLRFMGKAAAAVAFAGRAHMSARR